MIMEEAKCPLCASQRFFVKGSEDEFESYDVEIDRGDIVFAPGVESSAAPPLVEDTETYCQRCSWHGPLGKLKKDR
jgi:hypothetical protein